MTDYTLLGENPTDLPKRAVRALTEKMTVLPETGRVKDADDLFLVVSESGSEYLVDGREGVCDCPDARQNLDADDSCKHERRVRYATGETPIPEWVNTEAIDSMLGFHTATTPVRVATDGGSVAEESSEDTPSLHEGEHEECDCNDLGDNFPCWSCVKDGRRELPE